MSDILKTKVVLFDADGVIVVAGEPFSKQYADKFNIPLESILPFFKQDFPKALTGSADLKEILLPWLQKWKCTGTVDAFVRSWCESSNEVDVRVREVVRALRAKGIRCCLLTNNEAHRVQYMKEEMGFGELFDKVYSSADIGYVKPQKDLYAFVLSDLKKHAISPSEILFFDDDQKNVDGACKAGIMSVLYTDFQAFERIVSPLYNQK